jgi:TUG ubiquitin-like domain
MHEHKIHLTIETVAGKYQHAFNGSEKLQKVVDQTIEHFHIEPVPGGVWELRHDGTPLDLKLTIHEAHLSNNVVLTLAMHEHKIHLTIETLSGKYEHAFNPHDKLQLVVDETLKHLKIKPAPGDIWQLQYNGATLTLSLTIMEAHIPNNAVLTLATKESGGGYLWTRQ